MKSILASVDDVDTRKNVLRCFELLPQVERVAFICWCADRVNALSQNGNKVIVKNDSAEFVECYLDFWQIVSQWGLDVQSAIIELERRVRIFTANPFEKNPNVSIFVP